MEGDPKNRTPETAPPKVEHTRTRAAVRTAPDESARPPDFVEIDAPRDPEADIPTQPEIELPDPVGLPDPNASPDAAEPSRP